MNVFEIIDELKWKRLYVKNIKDLVQSNKQLNYCNTLLKSIKISDLT